MAPWAGWMGLEVSMGWKGCCWVGRVIEGMSLEPKTELSWDISWVVGRLLPKTEVRCDRFCVLGGSGVP